MVSTSWDGEKEDDWKPYEDSEWYKARLRTSSASKMSQKTLRQGYSLNVVDIDVLVEELIGFLKSQQIYDSIRSASTQSNRLKSMRSPKSKEWLQVTACPRLRQRRIPSRFHELAASAIWSIALSQIREYGKGKFKTEKDNETPQPILAAKKRHRSPSVASNMSTASMTERFGLTTLENVITLADANVMIMDTVNVRTGRALPLLRCMSVDRQKEQEAGGSEIKAQYVKFDVLKNNYRIQNSPSGTHLAGQRYSMR